MAAPPPAEPEVVTGPHGTVTVEPPDQYGRISGWRFAGNPCRCGSTKYMFHAQAWCDSWWCLDCNAKHTRSLGD